MTFWEFMHLHFEGVVVFVAFLVLMVGIYKLISKELL